MGTREDGLKPIFAPLMVKNSPLYSTVSPLNRLRRTVAYSRMILSGRVTFTPTSASAVAFPVPSAAATLPGAISSIVAIAMAVIIGCLEYGVSGAGTTVILLVVARKAAEEETESRKQR